MFLLIIFLSIQGIFTYDLNFISNTLKSLDIKQPINIQGEKTYQVELSKKLSENGYQIEMNKVEYLCNSTLDDKVQIIIQGRGGVKLEFFRNLFDSIRKRQKKFEKFNKFQFEICSIRQKKIRKICKIFQIQFSDSKKFKILSFQIPFFAFQF